MIDYSKAAAKIRKYQRINLEEKLKDIENNLTSEENRKLYSHYKNELETIYDHIADGIRIRSKCEWYEHGEKSKNFFLYLEKERGVQNRIWKFIVEEKEIPDHKKYLITSKHFTKLSLNETSLKPILKNKNL